MPLPTAQAPVLTVTVATDRTDYVDGMTVIAAAALVIDPPYNQADEPARVEWFNETWAVLRVQYAPKSQVNQRDWSVVAAWSPPGPGMYHVNVSSNTTNGTLPLVTGSATFRVWDPADYVIARGIEVHTDKTVYERPQVVTATANLTALSWWILGNASRLERVQFNWYYPSGAPARLFVNVSVAGGQAVDAWAPNLVGPNYTVTAMYLGNDTVTNATAFHFVPETVLATDVLAGQSVTWDAGRLWRVCGDLAVTASGRLVIEANTTVKFCRGSRLLVYGELTADGTPSAPITFTSYEFPPAPGDWAGIWYRPGSAGELLGVVVEHVTDGILVSGSSPAIVGLSARLGTGDAVNFTGSSATLRDASIAGFARGVRLWNASALVQNVTIANATREAVSLLGTSGAVLRDLRATGANISFLAISSQGVLVERADLTGALIRALDVKASTITLVNASITASVGGQDFLLVGSTATLLNCTFADDPARRTLVTPSRLIVQNFLAVTVHTTDGAPVAGARVDVTVNGLFLPTRFTDARGLAEWIVVEDRVYDASGVAKNTVLVNVSRDGYSINGTTRTVDMAISHTEAFDATRLNTPTDDGLSTGLALLVGLVSALLLAFLFLVLWRRRGREEAPPPESPAGPSVAGRPVRPGECYAVLREKPDAAFERFVLDIGAGVPGLCITRIRPEDVRARYNVRNAPVYWLSRSFGTETMNPTNLGAIVELVRKHTKEKPACRVLVDGLEYLYTQNGFGKVVKFVQALADVVSERRAVLFLPVNPKSFDADQLAILTRDLQTWT